MDLNVVLTFSQPVGRYTATAYPTGEAAEEYGASVLEAVDQESAAVSSCLRTLLGRRRQAGDTVKAATFSFETCQEMQRWAFLDEWRASLHADGIQVHLEGDPRTESRQGQHVSDAAAERDRVAA